MRYLNSCGNSEEKEITFGRGNWGVGQKNFCYTDWLSTGIKDLPMLRIKGKISQEFRVDLFSKRNWPIYSGRVVSCVFKLIHFRVCSL